jgi:hypothetical protein
MAPVSDTVEIRVLIQNDECTDTAVTYNLEVGAGQFDVCYHGLTSLTIALAKVGIILDRLRDGQPLHEAGSD